MIEVNNGEAKSYKGNYSNFLQQKAQQDQTEATSAAKFKGILRRELAWLRQGPKARSTKQKARLKRIKEVLKFLKLEHLAKESARNLSAGHQQLISIIRALIIKPNFLFLDEPCSNLDLKTIAIIENLLKLASRSGVKIIIVTHDLFQAKRLSDEILFFYNGKIFEKNKTKNFFKNPKSKEAKDFKNGLLIK